MNDIKNDCNEGWNQINKNKNESIIEVNDWLGLWLGRSLNLGLNLFFILILLPVLCLDLQLLRWNLWSPRSLKPFLNKIKMIIIDFMIIIVIRIILW